MNRYLVIPVLLILLTACNVATPSASSTEAPATDEMGVVDGMDSGTTEKYAPTVGGLYEGGEVYFIHTEASDPDVAGMLTTMMDGPLVVLVPELADAADGILANVYVFTNGIDGMVGPFGFQPDIFDAVPGDDAYRPLRRVNLIAWNEGSTPRVLVSLAELLTADAAKEVSITQPGIVVNMPVLVWPGGSR